MLEVSVSGVERPCQIVGNEDDAERGHFIRGFRSTDSHRRLHFDSYSILTRSLYIAGFLCSTIRRCSRVNPGHPGSNHLPSTRLGWLSRLRRWPIWAVNVGWPNRRISNRIHLGGLRDWKTRGKTGTKSKGDGRLYSYRAYSHLCGWGNRIMDLVTPDAYSPVNDRSSPLPAR